MKILSLIQGTPEWHLHRATHLNASDAPAMLGVSTYKTRDQLIREKATGITPEVDNATQQRFDEGHRSEALARPLAEAIVGEDLFPCVGEDGKFSASFDGLTMLGDTAFEHKSLNDKLRAAIRQQGGNANEFLPELYLVQMEHQSMVSGAERVLFMASKWVGDELVEERHCWYTPDAERRSRVVAGWDQFEADVAAYQPDASAPAVVVSGRAPEELPALRVEVTGMVTASNLVEFKDNAMAVLGNINRDLQTDEDFANADKTVKWCKDVEERLDLTKQQVLGQTADIAAVFRTMDEVAEETRRVRLELDRLVKNEKDRRRSEIVGEGVAAVRAHYETINATLSAHALYVPASIQSVVAEAIKGKKTITTIREAANGAAASLKIAASQTAERVRGNIAILAEYPDHSHLFADSVQLCSAKEPADLRNLAVARIAEHRERQAAQEQADRDRIRREELAKIEQERADADAAAERERAATAERERVASEAAKPAVSPVVPVASPAPSKPSVEALSALVGVRDVSAELRALEEPLPVDLDPRTVGLPFRTDKQAALPAKTIKLGDINARIAPLSITADGLASIGFQPVGTDRAAKLYAESDLLAIYRGLYSVIQNAANELKQAA